MGELVQEMPGRRSTETLGQHMTREIQIGSRGIIAVYFDGQQVRVKNLTSCHLIIDDQMVAPGEEV